MYVNILNTKRQLEIILSEVEQAGEVVIDTETTSLATHSKDIKIVGLGLCYSNEAVHYCPFNSPDNELTIEDFRPIIESEAIAKIGHNIKYDARVLHRFDLKIKNVKFDTLLAHYCIYGDRAKHNLDDITLEYLNHVKIRTKDVIPRKSKKLPNPTMWDCDINMVAVYCAEDVWDTRLLYHILQDELKASPSAKNLFYNIELPLLPTLIDMECSGVAIDKAKIVELNTKFNNILTEETQKINTALGRPLALTNPNDISKALFEERKVHEKLGIQIATTPTGKYKTDKNTLKLFESDEVVGSILSVKKLNKLINTYMLSFPQFISEHTGRIHAFFNQCVTSTGRLSSSEPNLQNQPQRDELGKEIRSLYISRWKDIGGMILAADYSQAELRILCHIASEPVLKEIFDRNGDAHLGVASKIYKKPEDQITKQERTFIKTINFGLLYGMGPKKLGLSLGISTDDAKVLMDMYLGTLKGVKNFIKSTEKFLMDNGYTETFFGRRRFIPKIFSSDKMEQWAARREGVNHVVQGTNADIIKMAMVVCRRKFMEQNLYSQLILQVHDELVFDVHPDEIDVVKKIVVDAMEGITQFNVAMISDAKFGTSWAEAH